MTIRRIIARAAVALAVCFAGATLFASTYYGVFVGVDYYSAGISSLFGCDRDAINMMDAYTANGYCAANNATVYLDYGATKSAVRTKFQQLASVAQSGDTVLYYQSSHGGDYDDIGGSFLCMTDDSWYDYEFAEDLARFNAGVRVVVVIDTCYSGGMYKADGAGGAVGKPKFQFAANAQRILNERLAARDGGVAKSGASVGWITACDWYQTSLAGPYGSVFTNAIIDGWKYGSADSNTDGIVTFSELGQYAVDTINSVREQNTQVENDTLLAAVNAGSVFDLSTFRMLISGDKLYGFVGTCPSTLTIPSGITDIAESAFDADFNSGVDAITAVTFPASLEYIGEYAFYGCSSLSSVTFLGNRDDVEIEGNAFFQTPVVSDFVEVPDNDNFANAEVISGTSGYAEGDSVLATYESGEPLYNLSSSTHTLWYRWTAPSSDTFTFDTYGSSFDTVLGVYTGSSLYSLTTIGENDDTNGRQSQVTFSADAGTTYYIAVGGYQSYYGDVVLNWDSDGGGSTPATLTWYTSRATAVAAAQSAGFRILLVSGRDSCDNTQYMRQYSCTDPSNAAILNAGFILWYNNCDTQGDEIWDYTSGLGSYTLPLVCALDPNDMDSYIARSTGYMDEDDLHSFLASLPSDTPIPHLDDNDYFAGAWEIDGSSCYLDDDNYDATYESGEPLYNFRSSTHTRWYLWTAPYSGTFTVDTDFSTFDTVLGVYTGSSLGSLSIIGENDDNNNDRQSAVTFSASSGTAYYIAVGGYGSLYGDIALNLYPGEYSEEGPSNDYIDGAWELDGSDGWLEDDNYDATYESGEPLYNFRSSTHTRWYRWTAPTSDYYTFDTDYSTFDTVLGVYTGGSLGSLSTIGQNDDNTGRQSAVTFWASSGTTYYIAVGGWHDNVGDIVLNWYPGDYIPLGPANDDFADAEVISGADGYVEGNNENATYESGEPLYSSYASTHTLWYRWTASASGYYTFDTEEHSFDTMLGVYTGSSVYSLSTVAVNDDAGCGAESAVTFWATSGTTYYIAVGGYHDNAGDFGLYWDVGTYGTLNFNANGGQGTMAAIGVGYGQEAALPACTFTRPGYRFLGWSEWSGDTNPDFTTGDWLYYYECGVGSSITLYAIWERMALWDPVAQPGSGVAGDAPFTAEFVEVYDAFVYDAYGNLAGTIQLKTSKAKISRATATEVATVAAAIQMAGERKVTLKGELNIASGVFDATGSGGALHLLFGANGVTGTYGGYYVSGAENKFSSRDPADKTSAASVLSTWGGSYGVAWADDYGWNCLSLTVAAKGKVKVAGNLADGTKVSGKAQLIVGQDECVIPVVITRNATLAFNVRLMANGRVMVTGLGWDVEAGRTGVLDAGSKFHVSRYSALWSKLPGTVLLDYLPNNVSVTEVGGRWNVPKAGKVAYVRGSTNIDTTKLLENPAGLKLTYKANVGTFKGSFKVYSDVGGRLKATKVNVVGVAINGEAYATLFVRGAGYAGATIWASSGDEYCELCATVAY